MRRALYVSTLLFVAPALAVYVVFIVYPLASSLWGSLSGWNGLVASGFVGIGNFIRLFKEPILPRVSGAFTHNVVWFLGSMVIQNGFGMVVAYLMYRRGTRMEFFKVAFFLPAVLSPILVGALWRIILAPNGPVSNILMHVGLTHQPITWLSDPNVALPIVILVDTWNWLGLPLLVFLAGFNDIPKEVIESAFLEGANEVRLLFQVALPLVMSSITMLTVLTFINEFNQFDIVYIMEGVEGNPNHVTDTLGTLFYRLAFGSQGGSGITDTGAALALAGLLFVFILVGSSVGLRALGNRVVRF